MHLHKENYQRSLLVSHLRRLDKGWISSFTGVNKNENSFKKGTKYLPFFLSVYVCSDPFDLLISGDTGTFMGK